MTKRKTAAADLAPAASPAPTVVVAPIPSVADAASDDAAAATVDAVDGISVDEPAAAPIAAADDDSDVDTGAEGAAAGGGIAGFEPEIDFTDRTIAVRSAAARGRWRIGRHFTQEPVTIEANDLSDLEIGRLLADPELIVSLED